MYFWDKIKANKKNIGKICFSISSVAFNFKRIKLVVEEACG